MEDLKDIMKCKGFLTGLIASALFYAYIVDVSKGLAGIVQVGNTGISDLKGITIFYFVPGFFSIMLPSYYLSRGIPHYRVVFLVILLLCTLCMPLSQ